MGSRKLVDPDSDGEPGPSRVSAIGRRVGEARARVLDAGRSRFNRAAERWPIVDHGRRAHARFRDRDGVKESAALTYYGFLCTFPFLIVVASVIAHFGDNATQVHRAMDRLIHRVAPGLLPTLSPSVKAISSHSVTVGLVSFALFLWTAVTVVQKLQRSLADMFAARQSATWRNNGRVALFLVAVTVIVLFFFVATGFLESRYGISRPFGRVKGGSPPFGGVADLSLDLVSTFAMYFVVGVVMLTVLPGHRLGWRVVRTGALIGTVGWTVLYTIGVRLVSEYLATNDAAYYGVAVSTLVLLVTINIGARITLIAAAWAAENLPGGDAEDGPGSDDEVASTAWVVPEDAN